MSVSSMFLIVETWSSLSKTILQPSFHDLTIHQFPYPSMWIPLPANRVNRALQIAFVDANPPTTTISDGNGFGVQSVSSRMISTVVTRFRISLVACCDLSRKSRLQNRYARSLLPISRQRACKLRRRREHGEPIRLSWKNNGRLFFSDPKHQAIHSHP